MKELISHPSQTGGRNSGICDCILCLRSGIILLCLRMVWGSLQYIPNLNTYPNYDDLLEVCFNPDHRCRIDPYDVFALSEYRI